VFATVTMARDINIRAIAPLERAKLIYLDKAI